MRKLTLFAVTMLLALQGAAALAQDRVARAGEMMWRASGLYCDTTQRGFVAGLGEQSYVEGRNLVLLQRSADSDPARFKPLAGELAAAKVDVFFAPASLMATGAW